MKYLVVILSAILTVTIIVRDIFSNKLSDCYLEKTNQLLSINRTLLDSNHEAFYSIGNELDAIGFLVERRADEYKREIEKAKDRKTTLDALYQRAQSDYTALKEKDENIVRLERWHTGSSLLCLVMALLILIISLFSEKRRAPECNGA